MKLPSWSSQVTERRWSQREWLLVGLVASLAWFIPGCGRLLDKVAGEVVRYRLESLIDFQGIMAQRTLITPKDVAIVSRIRFLKPQYYSSEVIAPDDYAGYRVATDGTSLSLYLPWEKTLYRAIGLIPQTPEQTERIIQQATAEIAASFAFTSAGGGEVGNRPTDSLTISATPANPRKYGGRIQLDRETSFPLEILVSDERGYQVFHYRYQEFTANSGLSADSFRWTAPPGTLIYTWDFAKPAVSLEKAIAAGGFPILLPRQLPEGFALKGVFLSESDSASAPRVVLLDFGQSPSWLTITQRLRRQDDPATKALPLYIPLMTLGGFARYYPLAGGKMVTWEQGDHAFSLFSNLPLPQITDIIDGMEPAS